jgi:hypothetical protein
VAGGQTQSEPHAQVLVLHQQRPGECPFELVCVDEWTALAIEQCFEESKSDVGMDHYEIRTYEGWHHHMLTTLLAHFFLWRLKIGLEKKNHPH